MTDMQLIAAGLTATQIRYIKMYLDGSTQKDIAQKYRVVPSSVSHAIRSARQKLQASGLQSDPMYDHEL